MHNIRSLNLSLAVYFAVVMAVLAWTASHLFPPINLDVGALLYVANRWLAGDRLYVDVIDVNTPWAIALHVPAEFTADWLGLDGPTWFSIYVVLAILIAVALIVALTRRYQDELGTLTARALPLLALFALGVDPGHGFGQREHLLMIAATPYLTLAALRASNVAVALNLRIAVGVIAGLGFAIKPHFLLPFAMVELYILFVRGPRAGFRDIVPWIIAGVQATHLVFALLVTPEYFSKLVPLAATIYADPSKTINHAWKILIGPQLGPVLALLPVLLMIAIFGTKRPLLRILWLFTVGAAAMAAFQGKGWDYHAIPALYATLMLTALAITKLVERYVADPHTMTPDMARIVAACLVIPFMFQDGLRLQPFRDQIGFNNSAVHAWMELMERDKASNNRALVLSAGMFPQFPAMNYADYKMAMPFLTLWPLNGLYGDCGPREQGYRPLSKQSSEEAYFFNEVVDGFVDEQPHLLVVDKFAGMTDCSGRPFEYLPYFMRDGRFAKAFRNYRPLATIGQYAFYQRLPDSFISSPAKADDAATQAAAYQYDYINERPQP